MPLMFDLPGQLSDRSTSPITRDVRIEVFGTEMYLHSSILTQHSSFFLYAIRHNEPPTPQDLNPSFVSVVDEDGEWRLEREHEANRSRDMYTDLVDKRRKLSEAGAFVNVISTMYKKPFGIGSIDDLDALTRAAELIQALPIVSKAIDEMMTRSPEFVVNFLWTSREVLVCARKLTHKALFEDALIYAVCEYTSQPDYTRDSGRLSFRPPFGSFKKVGPNPLKGCADLGRLIEEKVQRLEEDVVNVYHHLLVVVSRNPKLADAFPKLEPDGLSLYKGGVTLGRAKRLFRAIVSDEKFVILAGEELESMLKRLLSNHLNFQGVAGPAISDNIQKRIGDGFLCTKMEDRDWPWNIWQ